VQHITIKYRPFLLPWQRTINGSFPDKVEELNASQLTAVASLIRGSIADDTFLARMIGIKQKIVNRMPPFHKFGLMQLFTVFSQLAPHNQFIIKNIKVKNTLLCAPAPKLKDFTFGQFIFADTLFDDYSAAKTTAGLCRFVAALYIPAGEKFTDDMIDIYSPALEKNNPDTLEAIAINYGLVREWLSNAYPLIFVKTEPVTLSARQNDEVGQEVEGQQPESSIQQPRPTGSSGRAATNNGWLKVFESLVADDIVNHEKYAQLPLHNVLRYMSSKIKENMKRK